MSKLIWISSLGISDAFYCAECTILEKDRDGCPKIVNLGASRTDLFYERRRQGACARFYIQKCISYMSSPHRNDRVQERMIRATIQDGEPLSVIYDPSTETTLRGLVYRRSNRKQWEGYKRLL